MGPNYREHGPETGGVEELEDDGGVGEGADYHHAHLVGISYLW